MRAAVKGMARNIMRWGRAKCARWHGDVVAAIGRVAGENNNKEAGACAPRAAQKFCQVCGVGGRGGGVAGGGVGWQSCYEISAGS